MLAYLQSEILLEEGGGGGGGFKEKMPKKKKKIPKIRFNPFPPREALP